MIVPVNALPFRSSVAPLFTVTVAPAGIALSQPSLRVPFSITTGPLKVFAAESVSVDAPFFTRPPSCVAPEARTWSIVTSKSLEITAPPSLTRSEPMFWNHVAFATVGERTPPLNTTLDVPAPPLMPIMQAVPPLRFNSPDEDSPSAKSKRSAQSRNPVAEILSVPAPLFPTANTDSAPFQLP